MQSTRTLLIAAFFTVLLSGCGLSGPLYLEDGTESVKPEPSEDNDKQINSKIKDATG